jgi:hypothetical protein
MLLFLQNKKKNGIQVILPLVKGQAVVKKCNTSAAVVARRCTIM